MLDDGGKGLIDGGGTNNAVIITGVHGVALSNMTVRNGVIRGLGSGGRGRHAERPDREWQQLRQRSDNW
jgi:hypothetical protein